MQNFSEAFSNEEAKKNVVDEEADKADAGSKAKSEIAETSERIGKTKAMMDRPEMERQAREDDDRVKSDKSSAAKKTKSQIQQAGEKLDKTWVNVEEAEGRLTKIMEGMRKQIDDYRFEENLSNNTERLDKLMPLLLKQSDEVLFIARALNGDDAMVKKMASAYADDVRSFAEKAIDEDSKEYFANPENRELEYHYLGALQGGIRYVFGYASNITLRTDLTPATKALALHEMIQSVVRLRKRFPN
jgi:hypothetical protein